MVEFGPTHTRPRRNLALFAQPSLHFWRELSLGGSAYTRYLAKTPLLYLKLLKLID